MSVPGSWNHAPATTGLSRNQTGLGTIWPAIFEPDGQSPDWKTVVLGVLGILMGVAAIGFGVYSIFDQDRKIRSALPVDATVLSARIDEKRPHQLVKVFAPKIEFEYSVAGQQYVSEETTLIEKASSRSWAESVVQKYQRGQQVTAWVNGSRPEEAFLLKYYNALPYTAYLAGVLFVSAGVYLIREERAKKKRRGKGRTTRDGWYRLSKPWQSDRHATAYLVGGASWLVCGAPAVVHFLMVFQLPVSILFLVYMAAYNVTGAVFVIKGFSISRNRGPVGSPEIQIDRRFALIGKTFNVRVRQAMFQDGHADHCLKLICRNHREETVDGKSTKRTEVLYEQVESPGPSQNVRRNQKLNSEFSLGIPIHSKETTQWTDETADRVRWQLELVTRFNEHEFVNTFKIVVKQIDAE